LNKVTLVIASILFVAIFISCGSNRSSSAGDTPEFLNLKAFAQQTFPGVESDLWYTMTYRVEFDLRSKQSLTFNHLIINNDSVPVRMVMVGRILQMENGGKTLDGNNDEVTLTADIQVMRSDSDIVSKSHGPHHVTEMTLVYTSRKKTEVLQIPEVTIEKTIAYPTMAPRD
jgi:hypothetical protein